MNFSYATRLTCLCLEVIFLVNLAASVVVLALSRHAARAALGMRPRQAARLFLTLRLVPFLSSLCVVISICIPSYIRYERNIGSEQIGWFCLLTSALGLALCLSSVSRYIRALVQLHFLHKECCLLHPVTSTAEENRLYVTGDDEPGSPFLALVGILRPRLIVSPCLLRNLSTEQFAVALSHERAHERSQDNLKRLLLAVTPGILPFMRGSDALERHWERYAELAADDDATFGEPDRSLALAEALLQVARLGKIARSMPLASSLAAHDLELARRIDRLMSADSLSKPQRLRDRPSWSSYLLLAGCAALLVLLSEVLYPLYRLLEALLH